MTGIPIRDSSEGIWDDGEWISWEWINSQLYAQELQEEFPHASVEVIQVFEDLVHAAQTYYESTGRFLQIWGELGELYAEIKFGLKRHQPGKALTAASEMIGWRSKPFHLKKAALQITKTWEESDLNYGARKVWKHLRKDKVDVARCPVERLIREMGIS